MPRVDITVEQLLQAVRELPPEEQRAVRLALEDGEGSSTSGPAQDWVQKTRGMFQLDPEVLREILESDEFALWGS